MPVDRSVSIIGLGLMGSALARTFIKNGWKTTVWNRSPAKVDLLVATGALGATTVTECIEASRLVIICVLNAGVVHEVLATLDTSSCIGRNLINYTSGPRLRALQTHEMAMRLSFSAYLHGAILAPPELLGLPDSPIYYGGNKAALEAMGSDYSILGRPVYLGDDPALASLMGCIMMDSFFGLAVGFLQSVAVLKSSKLRAPGAAERFVSEELVPISKNYLTTLRDFARQIDNGNYLREDGRGMPLSLLTKTLQNMTQTHSENGISSTLFDPLLKLMQDRVMKGGGNEELSSLVEIIPVGSQPL